MNDAITVVGALGGDPTLKSVNGDQVVEFRLGCTTRRKEGEQWVNGHTNWFSVEAWGGFAGHVAESVRKGDVVVVLGKLRVDQWESGEKRGTSVKIRAEHIGHSLRVGPSTRDRRQGPEPQHETPESQQREPQTSQSSPEPEPHPQPAGQSEWLAPVVEAEPAF